MKIYSVFSILFIAALAGGCLSSAPTTVEKHGSEYKVVANSLLLNNHIRVLERSSRRMNGLLEAQVRGQSIKGKDVQFEYRFVWLDQDGIKIETQTTTWKPMALHAKEIALMKGMAPSPEATDFLMAVRFAHRSTRW